jgi:hypothetical protein
MVALGTPLNAATGKHHQARAAAHRAPTIAAHHPSKKGGGHARHLAQKSGVPGHFHARTTPKHHAPSMASRGPTRAHSITGKSRHHGIAAQQRRKPATSWNAPRQHGVAKNWHTRPHRPPSIAFGGRARTDTNRVEVRNRNYFIYRPPVDVCRNWDRDRVHEWNHHRYHWRDGAWAIVEPRFDYYYYDTAPTYSLEFNVDTPLVSDVQAALDRENYDPGAIDGVMGPQTRSAIAAYQEDHGLEVTGHINGALLRSLDVM